MRITGGRLGLLFLLLCATNASATGLVNADPECVSPDEAKAWINDYALGQRDHNGRYNPETQQVVLSAYFDTAKEFCEPGCIEGFGANAYQGLRDAVCPGDASRILKPRSIENIYYVPPSSPTGCRCILTFDVVARPE